MKKKSIIMIGTAITVIAIVCVAVLIWRKNDPSMEDSKPMSAEQITSFQQAIDKTVKPEEVENAEVPMFLESLRNSYSFEVISINPLEAKDTYQGTVRLTYANVADTIETYMNENSSVPFDEEKLNRDISELVSNAELVTEEFEMYFVKNGEELQPVFTEEMIDKMYGGIYSAYYNKLDEVASKMEGSEQN